MGPFGRRVMHRFAVHAAAPSRWRIVWVVLAVIAGALVLLGPARLGRGERVPPRDGVVGALLSDGTTFEQAFSFHTGVRVEPGNVVQLLLNGDGTFPALWRDLRSARRTIHVQQYFSQPGAVADSLGAILAARARAGVRVRVLLDAHGSLALGRSWRARLTAAGVDVRALRPLEWSVLHRAGARSHVRVVAIDDAVGYTGGFGFADAWLGDGRTPSQWRETNVRVEGPVVAQLQSAFAAAWFETTGELLNAAPQAATVGDESGAQVVRAGVFHSTASAGHMHATQFLTLALRGAERRLWIASSYFVPDAPVRAMLMTSAQRGVDVRVLTAGRSTDVRVARYAGRYQYGELLRAGVRIYEYEPTMMHAKTFVVDGAWASVGSMNIDNRSLALNDEVSVVVFDRRFAAQMDSLFLFDLRSAKELTLRDFERRPLSTRVLEWLATLASSLL